jgi:hypothetical protein
MLEKILVGIAFLFIAKDIYYCGALPHLLNSIMFSVYSKLINNNIFSGPHVGH